MARQISDNKLSELKKGMTQKQIRFAEALVHGGLSKAEAYRQVYGFSGRSKPAMYVRATEVSKSPKVSVLVNELQAERSGRLWENKERFRSWIMQGITDTVSDASSDITRLKALELAGRTVYASLFEEPVSNETNQAMGESIVSLIGARIQSLLGDAAPNVGDAGIIEVHADPMPSCDQGGGEPPTGGGEGA
jgi:hypothetical protein